MQASPEATAVAVKPPGRDRPNRRLNFGGHAPPSRGRPSFGEQMRAAMARPRLTDAEYEAIINSDEWTQAQREAYAALAQHEREQRLARNPAPVVATGTRRTTVRTRERRDRCGGSCARSGSSGSDDPGPSDRPAPADARGRA